MEAAGWGERLRLIASVVALGALPVWGMFTVTLAQVHPDLREVAVEVSPGVWQVMSVPLRTRMIGAGAMAAAWLGALVAVLVPVLALGAMLWRRRGAAKPATVLDASMMADAVWETTLRRDGTERPSRDARPTLDDLFDDGPSTDQAGSHSES